MSIVGSIYQMLTHRIIVDKEHIPDRVRSSVDNYVLAATFVLIFLVVIVLVIVETNHENAVSTYNQTCSPDDPCENSNRPSLNRGIQMVLLC